MTLTGANSIAGRPAASGSETTQARNPITGTPMEPKFHDATELELNQAVLEAKLAFQANRKRSAHERAELLDAIAHQIEELGDALVNRVMQETGLPEGRVRGERGRTMGQLRLFASLLREGSWVQARIDTALPDRAPIPKPDIRNMLTPLGPVAVFGASNFPLAFSVAGGDTASALAAGCPVVCKAHPAHPGTSELVALADFESSEPDELSPGHLLLVVRSKLKGWPSPRDSPRHPSGWFHGIAGWRSRHFRRRCRAADTHPSLCRDGERQSRLHSEWSAF